MPPASAIRPPADQQELHAFADIAASSFGTLPDNIRPMHEKIGSAMFRLLRARGKVAGGLCVHRMGQWFGGRLVSMTGVGEVAVAPEHRAHGLATRLMRAAVEEIHANGCALSALYPATCPLYQRAGYEIAGGHYEITLDPNRLSLRDRALELRAANPGDDAAIGRAWRTFVRRASGPLDRNAPEWRVMKAAYRPPAQGYAVWNEGRVEGFVSYGGKRPEGMMRLAEFFANTPAAARRLFSFLADHRTQVKQVKWFGNPVDPMLMVLPEPMICRMRHWDPWMLRIIDVDRALSERGYPRHLTERVHLEVQDDLLPANSGRFVLEVSDGRGHVRRGGRGSAVVDIRGLAALYSGHLSATDLRAMSGTVTAAPGPTATLDRIFAGPIPWMEEHF